MSFSASATASPTKSSFLQKGADRTSPKKKVTLNINGLIQNKHGEILNATIPTLTELAQITLLNHSALSPEKVLKSLTFCNWKNVPTESQLIKHQQVSFLLDSGLLEEDKEHQRGVKEQKKYEQLFIDQGWESKPPLFSLTKSERVQKTVVCGSLEGLWKSYQAIFSFGKSLAEIQLEFSSHAKAFHARGITDFSLIPKILNLANKYSFCVFLKRIDLIEMEPRELAKSYWNIYNLLKETPHEENFHLLLKLLERLLNKKEIFMEKGEEPFFLRLLYKYNAICYPYDTIESADTWSTTERYLDFKCLSFQFPEVKSLKFVENTYKKHLVHLAPFPPLSDAQAVQKFRETLRDPIVRSIYSEIDRAPPPILAKKLLVILHRLLYDEKISEELRTTFELALKRQSRTTFTKEDFQRTYEKYPAFSIVFAKKVLSLEAITKNHQILLENIQMTEDPYEKALLEAAKAFYDF